MSDAEKLLADLYLMCGGDPEVGSNPYMMFGYIKGTIEILQEKKSA